MVSCPQLRNCLAKALSFESRVGAPSPWHSRFGLIFLRMIEPTVIPSACVGGLDSPAAGGSWDRSLFVAVREVRNGTSRGQNDHVTWSKESLEPCTPWS